MSPVRAAIRELPVYAVDQADIAVKLNQNESPLDVPESVKEEILRRLGRMPWNRYPAADLGELRAAIGDYAGVPPGAVLPGNGANELIQAVAAAAARPGDAMLVVRPTFSVYRRVATALGLMLVEVPLDDKFGFDVAALRKAAATAAIVMLASPNNPSGTVIDPEGVAALASAAAGVVVIDEAYFEFHGTTVLPLLRRFDNLVIIRTFSKALSLAGARLGYLLAGPALAADIGKARLPFSVGLFQQAAAEVLLGCRAFLEANVREIVAERERLTAALAAVNGIRVVPSRANFFLCGARGILGSELRRRLLEQGVAVRYFDEPGLEAFIRVTVGRRAENQAFEAGLRSILAGERP